jgi:hypothetical protein
MNSRKKRLVGAAMTLLIFGVVGLVYAAWTTNGSGNGFARAGSAQDLSTLEASVVTTGDLYPNGDGTVTLKIHNPNPYPVTITDVTAGPGAVTASGGFGTCEVTGVSFNDRHGLSIFVPANDNSDVIELENAAHMSNESENGCQGAVFTIPVVLSGASADAVVSPT